MGNGSVSGELYDLGSGVKSEWWILTDPEDIYGPGIVGSIVEYHTCRDNNGEPYDGQGSVPIDPRILIGSPHWTITAGQMGSFEGLTLSPSILCQRCGLHGYIIDGKWVSV